MATTSGNKGSLLQLNKSEIEKTRHCAKKEFNALAKKLHLKYSTKEVNLTTPDDEKFLGGKSVFGVSLKELLAMDEKNCPLRFPMPVFAQMLFNCLEWHGFKHGDILKKDPDMKTTDAIKAMCAKDFYKQRGDIDEQLLKEPVHVCAHILKMFIRLLPGTIFTREYADAFAHLSGIKNKNDYLRAMRLLVFQLPPVNALVLHKLLQVSQKIAENQASNQMSVDAIARVITPSLFRVGEGVAADHRQPPFNLTVTLIEHREYLFTVSESLEAGIKDKDKKKDDVLKTKAKKVKEKILKKIGF